MLKEWEVSGPKLSLGYSHIQPNTNSEVQAPI